ncbi:MAG TPA: polysaccharide biosynthesis protein [Lutibacter sp.]|nr:polysaccharide biosynthesis protein [Lutibacter sp.]
MSNLKRFFKDSIIYGIAAVLPRVINFLLVRVHTDALAAETYAENTDFYIWAAFFAVLLTFGMETTFFRFYKDAKEKDALVSTSFISVGLWVAAFLIIFTLFFNPISHFFGFGNNSLRLQLFMAILALDTLAMIPFAFLRASNRPIRYTFIKLVNVGIIVLIQLVALRWIPTWEQNGTVLPSWLTDNYASISKVNYIFVANLVGSALSFLLLLPYLVQFKWKFDQKLLKKMLSYSYPIVIAGMAYVVNENLDKFLIGKLIDKETEGLYAAAYKLAIFMNLYIMAFRLGAEPFFFNISGQKDAKKTYAQIMKYFVIVGSFVLLGIVAFLDIIKHFINPDYWVALEIVPIVLLANLFLGIYHNLSIWYKLTDKTRFGMYFSIFGAIITIVFNVVMLPKIGYMASAWATLLAYGLMMLLSYWVGKKQYPIPYELKKTLGYLLLGISIAYGSYYLLEKSWVLSIAEIILFGLIIYYFEIRSLLKKNK